MRPRTARAEGVETDCESARSRGREEGGREVGGKRRTESRDLLGDGVEVHGRFTWTIRDGRRVSRASTGWRRRERLTEDEDPKSS